MPRITDFRALRRLLGAGLLAAVLLAAGAVTFAAITPKVDNPHGKFREECSLCHGASGWTPAKVSARFDHGARYGFPLTGAHSTSNCMTCHTTLEFAQTKTQCASCHKDPHQGELGTDCAHCHSARSFVDRGPMVKAHNLSRFPLSGGHATVDCESCHKGTAQGHMQFVGTPSDCKSCHMEQYRSTKNPDHVAGGYPTECQTCHQTGRWQTATFNHDLTAFPLTGVHRQTACASCHSSGTYKGLATACASCHQTKYDSATPNHVSAGFPAAQCATCHDTKSWSDALFDHNATAFPLTGAHKSAACNDCHSDGVYKGKSIACASCHQAQFGAATPNHTGAGFDPAACATCHDTQKWTNAVFDHNSKPFPLQGAHASAACNDCHADNHFADKPMNCLSCHQAKFAAAVPPHNATDFPDAKCGTCHGRTVWTGGQYNHAATRFPLTGVHVTTTCVNCHGDGIYSTKSTACSDCHMAQYNSATPAHTPANFPLNACATCHDTQSWANSHFDHSTTAFPLTGKHTTAACASCHGDGVYAGKATDCMSCHTDKYNASTPPHAPASFPPARCATCHDTQDWADAVFNHNTTAFPLQGAHATATCSDCHSDGHYADKPVNCLSCHQTAFTAAIPPHNPTNFPDAQCGTCHGRTVWTGGQYNHATTRFPLTGVHVTTTCVSCHGDGVYSTKSTACSDCHMTQYNSATPTHTPSGFPLAACATCHDTQSWANAHFDHNTFAFPLQGAHASAACNDCHADGHYADKPVNCLSCHQTAFTAATPPHNTTDFPDAKCGTCHGRTVWSGGTYNHAATRFPLTGVHVTTTCVSCHGDGVYSTKSTACSDCHMTQYNSATPTHTPSGFPLAACATCHDTQSWANAHFDHNTTAFPLTGVHATTLCASCHGDGVYAGKATDCMSCHTDKYNASTPPHTPASFPPARCATCHDTQAWSDAVFNHNTTAFPLQGAHATATCNSCHADGHYADKPINCLSCHQTAFTAATPPHNTTDFPDAQCGTCHGRSVWTGGVYNHAATRFPLTGAHISTTCVSCHGDGVYSTKSTACSDCHMTQYNAATPTHTPASFPLNACATCHTTTDWATSTFNHNTTAFPLTGKHTTTACSGCHGDGVYAGKSTDCYSCHKPTYDTAVPTHNTTYFPTAQCGTCHNTTAWTGGKINHDAPWFPIYTGRHAGTWSQCQTCHTNMANYAVFTCLSCHPHDNKTQTDSNHSQVRNYSYDSNSCYSCHPTGRAG